MTGRPFGLAFLTGVALLAVGCESGAAPEAGVIDREVFVAAYFDLRVAALAGDTALSDAQRDEILARHGISEAELLQFVGVHGRDVDYMAEVWGEVEELMDTPEAASDTAR